MVSIASVVDLILALRVSVDDYHGQHFAMMIKWIFYYFYNYTLYTVNILTLFFFLVRGYTSNKF